MACTFFFVFIFLISLTLNQVTGSPNCGPIVANDTNRIQFAFNLEFLEADFFLYGALGRGLDTIALTFAGSGPPPIGAKKANLDPIVGQIIEEFAYQELGHLRDIITKIGGISMAQLDLSPQSFANLFDKAVGFKLNPPFDPYLDTVHYLLASYAIPYVGLVGYVGIIPSLTNETSQSDASIRTLLYERADQKVLPYNMTVATFTNKISWLKNKLGMCGFKDEGIKVPLSLVAENSTHNNVLSADSNSCSYARTPTEILRIIYGSGSKYKPSGFYPNGGDGNIARSFLPKA